MKTNRIRRDHQRCITIAIGMAALGQFAAIGNAQNLILNGSFEHNSVGGTVYNMNNTMFNTAMERVTAYGQSNEIDVMDPSAIYGLPPVDGTYKLGLHRRSNGAGTDAFAFDIVGSIVAGTTYNIEFWAQAVTDFSIGLSPVEIGISASPLEFGTLAFTSGPLIAGDWRRYSGNFVAPVNGAYLTVSVFDGEETWAHVDHFTLTVIPAPAACVVLVVGGLFSTRRRRS